VSLPLSVTALASGAARFNTALATGAIVVAIDDNRIAGTKPVVGVH